MRPEFAVQNWCLSCRELCRSYRFHHQSLQGNAGLFQAYPAPPHQSLRGNAGLFQAYPAPPGEIETQQFGPPCPKKMAFTSQPLRGRLRRVRSGFGGPERHPPTLIDHSGTKLSHKLLAPHLLGSRPHLRVLTKTL